MGFHQVSNLKEIKKKQLLIYKTFKEELDCGSKIDRLINHLSSDNDLTSGTQLTAYIRAKTSSVGLIGPDWSILPKLQAETGPLFTEIKGRHSQMHLQPSTEIHNTLKRKPFGITEEPSTNTPPMWCKEKSKKRRNVDEMLRTKQSLYKNKGLNGKRWTGK